MKVEDGLLLYDGLGIDCLRLAGGYTLSDVEGEATCIIADADALHRAAAEEVCLMDAPLRGMECRFLRRWIDLAPSELGRGLGLGNGLIERLEALPEATLPPYIDRAVRLRAALRMGAGPSVLDPPRGVAELLAERLAAPGFARAGRRPPALTLYHDAGNGRWSRIPTVPNVVLLRSRRAPERAP